MKLDISRSSPPPASFTTKSSPSSSSSSSSSKKALPSTSKIKSQNRPNKKRNEKERNSKKSRITQSEYRIQTVSKQSKENAQHHERSHHEEVDRNRRSCDDGSANRSGASKKKNRNRNRKFNSLESLHLNPYTSLPTRNKFVCKVFAIQTGQKLIGFSCCLLCLFSNDVKQFVIQQHIILTSVAVCILVLLVIFVCTMPYFCVHISRYKTTNLLLFGVMSIVLFYFHCSICAFQFTSSPVISLGMTAICTSTIAIMAATMSEIDFTAMTWMITIFAEIIIVSTIVSFFVRFHVVIIAFVETNLFMMFVMLDIQTFITGKRLEIATGDFMFVNAQFYIDMVVMMFYMCWNCSPYMDNSIEAPVFYR